MSTSPPTMSSRIGASLLPLALVACGVAAPALATREWSAGSTRSEGERQLRDAITDDSPERRIEAAVLLEKAANAAPGRPEAWLALGEALSGKVVGDEAVPIGAVEGPDGSRPTPPTEKENAGAAEALRRALVLDPFSARAHAVRATALARLGSDEAADEEFERALRAGPMNPGIARAALDRSLWKGLSAGDEAALADARVQATRLAELDAASLSWSLPLLAPFVDRLTDLEALIPRTWPCLYRYAEFLTREGYWDEGLAASRAAAVLAPSADFLVHATIDFARHLGKEGTWDEALRSLEEAARLDGGVCPEPLLLGQALLNCERVEEAEAVYLSLLKKGVRRRETLEQAYRDFSDAGLVDESVVFLERVSKEVPFFYAPLYFLGCAEMARGEDKSALDALEKFVQYDRDPRAFEALYRLSAKSGQWRAASEYIRKALLYAPANETYLALLRDAEKRLDS